MPLLAVLVWFYANQTTILSAVLWAPRFSSRVGDGPGWPG